MVGVKHRVCAGAGVGVGVSAMSPGSYFLGEREWMGGRRRGGRRKRESCPPTLISIMVKLINGVDLYTSTARLVTLMDWGEGR